MGRMNEHRGDAPPLNTAKTRGPKPPVYQLDKEAEGTIDAFYVSPSSNNVIQRALYLAEELKRLGHSDIITAAVMIAAEIDDLQDTIHTDLDALAKLYAERN